MHSKPNICRLLLLSLTLVTGFAHAATWNLVVQPIQSPEDTRRAFQPLTDYLTKATGEEIRLVTTINFVAYWETMKKGEEYDLILDAAHFTDYRIQRMDYVPLVKLKDVVSFSLVTHEENPILEPKELIGKTVALLSSPSLDAMRLSQMFPNPLRQPVIILVDNSREAALKVKNGEVAAAMIPTPMVRSFPFLYTVQTTDQVPHMALSASPKVPPEVRQKIRKALLEADRTEAGRAMLQAIRLDGFEPASPETYKGYAKLLQGVFGY
ncbi:MAG TPA: phosphate/phosphite/phosphonate ABC transporter substrate-binding protein [Thiotrichales bacterium]|nr:phosphate/phosphite/phosphonate ABC transporter substrate-binding protein [Thiotrichales bacterium]